MTSQQNRRQGHDATDLGMTIRLGRAVFRAAARPFRLEKYEASEYQHQVALVECLRKWAHPDCCWHSIPNESAGGAAEGWHRKRMGRRPGVADLFFLFRGQGLYLELKIRDGIQSENQKSFALLVSRAWGEYVISYSIDESCNLLYARGILTRDLTKHLPPILI